MTMFCTANPDFLKTMQDATLQETADVRQQVGNYWRDVEISAASP